ncbi:MAG: HEAT repeat domain-containing protein [Candidatus Riflebacteria bacterium]|nr:HEAT repeat domain-containing protein [Candidatus Riflebacteria bacterium]
MITDNLKNLFTDLNSPEKSLRLEAVHQLLLLEVSPEISLAISERFEIEKDDELKAILELSRKVVKKRLEGKHLSLQKDQVARFQSVISSAAIDEKLELLVMLSDPEIESLAEKAPEILENEENPFVKAEIVKTFGRKWPKDSLQKLVLHLRSEFFCVRISVLEIFSKIAPSLLQRDLPKFLLSPDPRVRMLAINGLSLIDQGEALLHLEEMLSSENREARLLALKSAILFPIEMTKPFLLKYLVSETDKELIERAGLIFLINPDIETPYKLWELAENSSPEKSGSIKKIILGTIQGITKSGILNENHNAFIERLQRWVDKRKAKKFVQDIISRISDNDCNSVEIESLIRHSKKNPLLKKAFEESLEWTIPENARDKILDCLRTESTPEKIPNSEPAKNGFSLKDLIEKFESLSLEEKIFCIACLSTDEGHTGIKLLFEVIKTPNISSDLKATSFRTALRLQEKGFVDEALVALKCKQPNLLSSALDYLGEFSPDEVFSFLGTFLNHPSSRVRDSALKIQKKYDQNQSLSTIRALLKKGIEDKFSALSCLIHFDFSLIRSLLFEALSTSSDTNFIRTGLFFYVINADPEALFDLYQLEMILPFKLACYAAKARQQTEKILADVGLIDLKASKKREKDFAERMKLENEKKKQTPPDYSVKKLKESDPETILNELKDAIGVFYYLFYVFPISKPEWVRKNREQIRVISEIAKSRYFFWILFITMIIFLLIGIHILAVSDQRKGSSNLINCPVFSTQSLTLSGSVIEISIDGLLFKADDGKKFVISPPPEGFSAISPGDKIKIEIFPFRVAENGNVYGRCGNIEKIK